MLNGESVGKIGWSTLKVPWANSLCYVQVQASKYNPEVTIDDIKDAISDLTPVEIDFKDRPHLVTDRQIGLIMCMSEPAARVYVRKYNIQEHSERMPRTARINYYFDIREFYAKLAEDKSAPCLIYHAMRVRRAMERRGVKPF